MNRALATLRLVLVLGLVWTLVMLVVIVGFLHANGSRAFGLVLGMAVAVLLNAVALRLLHSHRRLHPAIRHY